MDRVCGVCSTILPRNYCWLLQRPRICLGSSSHFAHYTNGHMQSPLCDHCAANPAFFHCSHNHLNLCHDCFDHHQICIPNNHPVNLIQFTSHMNCADPNPGLGRGRRRARGRGRGQAHGLENAFEHGLGRGQVHVQGHVQGPLPLQPGPPNQPQQAAAAGLVSGVPTAPGMFAIVPGQQLGDLTVIPDQTMTQQATRHARAVNVLGLLPTADGQTVANFFRQAMSAIGGNTAGPGDVVVNVYIDPEKKSALVELRSVEEASNAMALDGIILEGVPLEVRRPTDYNPLLDATLGPSQPNPNLNLAAVGLSSGSTGGLESPDRIFVCGFPCHFTEAQVRQILESCGPLSSCELVRDITGKSKGNASCVYQAPSGTAKALAALNGIEIGDKTLTVGRDIQSAIALQRPMMQAGDTPTKIVCLTDVVITADDLVGNEQFEDILQDMRQEARKFGNLVNIVIPRPNPNQDTTPGVGKVFLEYADVDGASKARSGMNGRKFGGNQVVAVYYPESKFVQGDYEG